MNNQQWNYFSAFREEFKTKIMEWNKRIPNLSELQKQAAIKANTPEYNFETPIVYNKDLDKITEQDQIKLIVIGDNPGKDEQLEINNRYLVGQAGKLADSYFKKNQILQIDFRKNVIILNKTPVHSAKTNQLKTMIKSGGKEVFDLIEETQSWMAQKTAELQINLTDSSDSKNPAPELWLVGYSELKSKGIFVSYRDYLRNAFLVGGQTSKYWNSVFVFQHFSMNRFTIDLSDYINKNNLGDRPLIQNLHTLGTLHKNEIFNEQ